MPAPTSQVYSVKTCSPADPGDPKNTICFAGFDLHPREYQAIAKVPAPIILPTVTNILPAKGQPSPYQPQRRQDPPCLYCCWKTKSSTYFHANPCKRTFQTHGGSFMTRFCLPILLQTHTWQPPSVDYRGPWKRMWFSPCFVRMEQVQDPEELQFMWPAPIAVHWNFQLWWDPYDYAEGKKADCNFLLEFAPDELRTVNLEYRRQGPEGRPRPTWRNLLPPVRRAAAGAGPYAPQNLFS